MQRLEVSGAVRPIYELLGVKTVNRKDGTHVLMLHQRNAPVERVGSLKHSSVSAM